MWFVGAGTVLFAMGAAVAFLTVPKALDWLRGVGGHNFQQFYTADKYLQLIVYMMIAFGIGFEFPIVLVTLLLVGIVTTTQLRQARRYAIVIIAIVVAVGTPSSDPFSMLALCIPMWIFYEVAIVFGRIRDRRRNRRPAAA
jgi:sec-independent protein translocase protein TatC